MAYYNDNNAHSHNYNNNDGGNYGHNRISTSRRNFFGENINDIRKAENRVVHKGDIYYSYRTYEEAVGSEFRSGHPCIIISEDGFCERSGVVCAVYLTSAPREDLDTHVVISNDKINSTAICEQIISVSKSRLGSAPIARVSEEELKLIDKAVARSLGLEITHDISDIPTELAKLRTERDTYKKMCDSLINRITKSNK